MNKKLLLGLLALAAAHSAAEAQSLRSHINRDRLRNARLVSRSVNDNTPARPTTTASQRVQAPTPASWGELVGQTTYDLQTNRATTNRMAMTGNALSMVWTQNCVIGSFTNRGVGYNYSTDANGGGTPSFVNGTAGACGASAGTFGIASIRTGWPELAHSNGNEVVIAHSNAVGGLKKMMRPLGSGTWTASETLPFTVDIDGPGSGLSGFWPRMVASGSTLHLVYCDNGSTDPASPIAQPGNIVQTPGVVQPVVYARSLDGGMTWDKSNVILTGLDNANLASGLVVGGIAEDTASVGGDSYAIAVNGNNVAVCAHNLGTNTILSKSTDGGTTWTATRIMGGFTDADTTNVNGSTPAVLDNDGSMTMVIDNAGTVHWFAGSSLALVRRLSNGIWSGTGRAFTNASDALLYWNDRDLRSSGPIVLDSLDNSCPTPPVFTPCELASSAAAAGGSAYGLAGIVSMSTATLNAATGDVYVMYAGGRIGTSSDGTAQGQYLRDLYLKKLSFPGGGQVVTYQAKNISRDIKNIPDGAAASNGEESVYPSALHTVENNFIHYQWMSDFEPGTALQGTPVDSEVENAIMYDRIDVSTLTWSAPVIVTGIREELAANVLAVSASPNPTTGKTTLNLNLKQDARATIVVRNVLGQEVLRLPATSLAVGLNAVSLDLSSQGAGVYFYTVAADKFTLTQRVVKQ
ncbi:MAG: T9SS type A sorting domain-containing protein [Hymenobacteraceae bacterium]|nr:T9SS type A sorting domain-containing protein [Hymenobacteraceae bacterium]